MKTQIVLSRLFVFCLSAFCAALAAFADAVWPTATTGKDGNLASTGSDGWGISIPTDETCWFYGGGTYTASLLDGSELQLNGWVYLRNMTSKAEAHVTLEVANEGSHLKLSKFQMGDSNDDPNGTMRLYAHDKGQVTISTFNNRSWNPRLEFASGAVLTTTNSTVYLNGTGGNWSTGVGSPENIHTRILFNDATWNSAYTYFGYGTNWKTCPIELNATNSTFTFAGIQFCNSGHALFKGGVFALPLSVEATVYYGSDVTFDGCAVTNGKWNVGNANANTVNPPDSKLTIMGGSKVRVQGVSLAVSATSVGRTLVTGPGTELHWGGATTTFGYTDIGKAGQGYLTVSDGARFVLDDDFPGGMPVRLGVNAGSYGELNVTGGTVVMTNIYGLWLGCKGDGQAKAGTGQVNVSSGEMQVSRVSVGYATPADGTSRVRVTGGRFYVGKQGAEIDNNGFCALLLAKADHPSELVLEGGVCEVGAIVGGTAAQAKIVGNGGTLKRSTANYARDYSKSKKMISNIAGIEVGAQGLIVDTNGKDDAIAANVSNYGSEQGVFVKTGRGTLSYSGTFSASQTTIAQGALLLTDAAPSFQTALVVTNGATFSTVGAATGVTLTGLAVTNAVLALDPTDTLTVNGPVTFSGVQLVLSSTPALDDAKTLLIAQGQVDAATAQAWKMALADITLADGTHPSFTSEYDADTGKTSFMLTVKADVPLADATAWTGADGQWATLGNWSASLPTASKVAAFSDNGAATAVVLPASAVAGALSFAGQDFTLFGGSLYLPAEQGASRFDVAAGSTNEIASPVTIDFIATAETALRGWLTLSGGITGGGLVKKGDGRLTLDGTSAFTQYLQQDGGVLVAKTAGATGSTGTEIRHRHGTIAFESEGTSVLGQTLVTRGTNATDVTIVSASNDVTIADWCAESGKFMKRGPGKLTLKVKPGTLNLTESTFDSSNNSQLTFPEDGTAPVYPSGETMKWPGITVAEGELEITSDTPDAEVSAVMTMLSGFQTLNGTVDPCLTIRGLKLTAGGNDTLAIGRGQATKEKSFSVDPRVCLIDSVYKTGSLNLGTWCYGPDAHQHLAVTNSTLWVTWQMQLAQGNDSNNKGYSRITAKDSTFQVTAGQGGYTWFAGICGDFDNTYFGSPNGACSKLIGASERSHGYMAFRNGSTFAINTLDLTGARDELKLVFDDSTWSFGADDFVLDSTKVHAETFKLEMEGKGLIVAPSSGKTLTLDVPVVGEGGFVNRGAGTVVFKDGRYQFTGKLVAEAGVINLSQAGTVTNATIAAGAGVISGGTFHNATIALDSVGAAVPNLQNCTFTGRTRVTVGGEPTKAADMEVLRYTGTLDGVGTFALKGWKGWKGAFVKEADKVVADLYTAGLLLFVR